MNQRWIWALAWVLSVVMGSFSPLCGSDIRETENDKAALKKDFFGQEEDFEHKKRLAFHHVFESLWHLAKNKGQENEGTKHHVQEVEKLNVKGRQKEFKETKDLIEKSLTASYRTHHLLGRLTPNVEHHNDQDWKKEILSHARIAEEGFCQLFGFLPPLKEEGLLDEILRTSYEKEAFKDFTPCVFPRHLGNGFNIILTRDDKENTATFKVFSWQKAATEQSVLLLEKTLSQFPQALDFQDSEIPLVFKGLVDEQRRLVIQRLFSPSSVRLNAPEMRLGHRKDVEGVQGAVEPTFSPDQDDLTLLDFGLLSIGEELEVSGEIFDLVWGQAHISKNLRMTMSKMIRLGRYVQFPQSFQDTFESYPVTFSYLYQLPLGMTEKEKEAGSAEAYFEQVKKEDRTEMKLHVKGSAVLDAPLLQNDYADLQIEKELYSYIKRYENKGRILLKSQGYFFGDPYIRSHQAFETLISYSAAREVRFQDRTMEVSYPMPVGPHPVWWIEGYMQFMDPNVVVFEYCGDFHKFAEDAFCGVETIEEKTVAPSAEELQSLRAAGSSQRKVILVDRREAYSTIGHGLHIKFNEQRYAESMRQASERSGGHGLASLNATWGAQSALHNFHYGRFGAAGSEQALQKLQTYFQDPGLSSTFSSAAKSFYQSHPHLLRGNTTTSSSMPSFASNLQNRINTLRKEDLQQAKTTYKTFKEPELLASYKTKPQTKERFVEAKDGDYASLMRRTPRKKRSSSAYELPNPLLDQAQEGSRWYRRGTAREEKNSTFPHPSRRLTNLPSEAKLSAPERQARAEFERKMTLFDAIDDNFAEPYRRLTVGTFVGDQVQYSIPGLDERGRARAVGNMFSRKRSQSPPKKSTLLHEVKSTLKPHSKRESDTGVFNYTSPVIKPTKPLKEWLHNVNDTLSGANVRRGLRQMGMNQATAQDTGDVVGSGISFMTRGVSEISSLLETETPVIPTRMGTTKVGGESTSTTRSTSTTATRAESAVQAEKLRRQLIQEQQLSEPGRVLFRGGKDFRDAEKFAKQYGGKPEDWVKKTSSSFPEAKGARVETHWVENLKTGQKVDIKMKNTIIK